MCCCIFFLFKLLFKCVYFWAQKSSVKQISGFGSKRPRCYKLKGNFSLVLMRVMLSFLTFLLSLPSKRSYTDPPLRLTYLTNEVDRTHGSSCGTFTLEFGSPCALYFICKPSWNLTRSCHFLLAEKIFLCVSHCPLWPLGPSVASLR